MAHFQERRTGGDRRKHKNGDRRKNPNRRVDSDNTESLDFIDQARVKAWLVMTDKNAQG